jgi:hypothetical protein
MDRAFVARHLEISLDDLIELRPLRSGDSRVESPVSAAIRFSGWPSAKPSRMVNTVTGEGLEAALDAADVVIDLANSPIRSPSGARSVTRLGASWT